MDVSLVLIIVMAVLFGCGVYAMLERSLTRVLIGFLLLGNAVNLLLLIVMGRPGRAPFYGTEGDVSDPLPQALTLTAIVITFAVSAFLLALIYRPWSAADDDLVRWIQSHRLEIDAGVASWRSLLTIESNQAMDLWINDANAIYFFLPAADLARADFSNVQAITAQS